MFPTRAADASMLVRADVVGVQVRLLAAMLQPLLDAISSSASLADPAAAASVAAASAGVVSSATTSRAASPAPGPPASPTPGSASTGGGTAAAAAAAAGGHSSSAGSVVPGSIHHTGQLRLGGVAAAAAALLQLRLLELFFFLPAPQLWSSCHAQLLQLCCRQLLGAGGSRVRPGGLAMHAAKAGLLLQGVMTHKLHVHLVSRPFCAVGQCMSGLTHTWQVMLC